MYRFRVDGGVLSKMSQNNSNNTSEPIYKYYIEATSTSHYPTVTELAEFLGIYSKYGQLYPSFITAYMDSIGADKMYYLGKKGKVRVINNWGMVIQMLVLLNAKMDEKKDSPNGLYFITIKIGKKNYHLCIVRKKVENALNVAFEADDR